MKTILILASILALSSCSLTVGADGSRTWSVSGEEAAKAIIIYSAK